MVYLLVPVAWSIMLAWSRNKGLLLFPARLCDDAEEGGFFSMINPLV
jgi:hypothetical protein